MNCDCNKNRVRNYTAHVEEHSLTVVVAIEEHYSLMEVYEKIGDALSVALGFTGAHDIQFGATDGFIWPRNAGSDHPGIRFTYKERP